MTKMIIARVIDIAGNDVILLAGHTQHKVSWPQAVPVIGDVFEVVFEPSLEIIHQLAKGNNEVNWPESDTMRWRKPDANGKTRMEVLWQRHNIKRAVRDYLDAEGFIEIDTPLLVRGTTPDVEIESFAMDDRYLITSAEYQIKRMEIGGFDRSYTLTQNYRKGDRGTYRNPEFTMLEWARVGQTLGEIENDVEKFTLAAHKKLGGNGTLKYQGHEIDLTAPWERLTVRQAVEKHIGVALKDFSAPSMADALRGAKIEIRAEWESDPVFLFTILLDHIQQFLGFGKPVFLTDWPVFLTSSAAEHKDGGFAERSELFVAGVELSDGFPSLTDLEKQKAGFQKHLERRKHEGKASVELDDIFLETLKEGFPIGAGMALGFDRLVMILTDQPDIAAVLAFNWDEV